MSDQEGAPEGWRFEAEETSTEVCEIAEMLGAGTRSCVLSLHSAVVSEPEEYVFPEEWWDLRGNDVSSRRQADALEAELGRELDRPQTDHRALARFTAQDEALFVAAQGTYLIAHLTWKGSREGHLRLRYYGTWEEACGAVERWARFR